MAFFKFRQGGENSTPATRPAESVEVMRQRAKHRLIGSVVLVLVGVIGFPLLFDTQPRPIPVDVQIDMPDRNKVAPLQIPAPVAVGGVEKPVDKASDKTPNPVKSGPAKSAAVLEPKVTASASLDPEEQLVPPDAAKPAAKPPPVVPKAVPAAKPEVKAEAKPEVKAEAKAEPKVEAKATPKPDPKPESRPESKGDATSKKDNKSATDEAARAKSLLEGKDSVKTPAAEGRFVIQVGAFAEAPKAREARMTLERAGLKTYTHVAETKEGQRIRVRVGPFSTRAEAEKVAAKVKTLSLPAAILTL